VRSSILDAARKACADGSEATAALSDGLCPRGPVTAVRYGSEKLSFVRGVDWVSGKTRRTFLARTFAFSAGEWDALPSYPNNARGEGMRSFWGSGLPPSVGEPRSTGYRRFIWPSAEAVVEGRNKSGSVR
jgi:hypothetical protein